MGLRDLASKTVAISSAADVDHLRSSPARLWNLQGPITLHIPGLTPQERERLESRLNELAGVCGCAEGSVAGAIALMGVAAFWIQREIALSWQSALTAGATVIGVSLIARLARLMTARLQLRKVLGETLRILRRNTDHNQPGAAP